MAVWKSLPSACLLAHRRPSSVRNLPYCSKPVGLTEPKRSSPSNARLDLLGAGSPGPVFVVAPLLARGSLNAFARSRLVGRTREHAIALSASDSSLMAKFSLMFFQVDSKGLSLLSFFNQSPRLVERGGFAHRQGQQNRFQAAMYCPK